MTARDLQETVACWLPLDLCPCCGEALKLLGQAYCYECGDWLVGYEEMLASVPDWDTEPLN